METIEYTLPIYWASYLINGDDSGLDEKEIEEINYWLESEGNPQFTSVSEGTWFSWRNDANNLGGEVATYTAYKN